MLNNELSYLLASNTYIAKSPMETAVDSSPNSSKVLLTEQFDEGLMVLRRLLKWDMVDMTYLSMYKTVKGSKRYDGKELIDAPLFNDLPEHVRRDLGHGSAAIIRFTSAAGARPWAGVACDDERAVHLDNFGRCIRTGCCCASGVRSLKPIAQRCRHISEIRVTSQGRQSHNHSRCKQAKCHRESEKARSEVL